MTHHQKRFKVYEYKTIFFNDIADYLESFSEMKVTKYYDRLMPTLLFIMWNLIIIFKGKYATNKNDYDIVQEFLSHLSVLYES